MELVILFHRTAAAPWGHVASIIKRSQLETLSRLVPLPTTVSIRSIVAALDGIRILVPSTTRDPRATNARAELKGTGHTQLSSSRHFICKLLYPIPYQTHFTHIPSKTHFTHKPYETYTYLQTYLHIPSNTFTKPYNLHNKPNHILHLELFLEFSFLNCYLHIRCLFHLVKKTVFIVVIYKLCCMYKSFVPFFESCHQFSTAV